MSPKDVNDENKHLVYLKLYGDDVGKLDAPAFKLGDRVRIRKYYFLKQQEKNKEVFRKGYIQKMTDEDYKISRVLLGDPVTYKIADDDGDEIFGIFYKEELVRALP